MRKILNFMQNLMMRFARFMSDRYARVDGISLACVILSVLLDIIAGFCGVLSYIILSVISFGVMIYAIYRPFSKNIWKREKENRMFMEAFRKIKAWFLLNYRRIRYFKKSVFVKCPRCRAVIRFPRKKGEHTARCPGCGEKFQVNVRF